MSDPNGATVGFEMIVPTLVAEAEQLGIIKRQGESILGKLGNMRKLKLQKMKGYKINRNVTMAFSAEMAGMDGRDMLEVENLLESNGSVAHSPSASAYFALCVNEGDVSTLQYLHAVVARDGGAPNLMPFDIYEKAWVLWNLSLYPNWDKETTTLFVPYLDYIKSAWNAGKGVGFSVNYTLPDGDDTIIAYDVLHHFGYKPIFEPVLSFEEKDHFRCYDLEVGLSPSVNIHALMALHHAGYKVNHPKTQMVLMFLEASKISDSYWIDKWHSSPYYTRPFA